MSEPSSLRVEPPSQIIPEAKPSISLRAILRRVLFWAMAVVAILALPFVVLVRSSVFFYMSGLTGGWIPVLGGALATTLLLVLYAAVAGRRLTGRWTLPPFTKRLLGALVVSFVLYGVVFATAGRSKSEGVQQGLGDVHPVLRLATGVLTVADPNLIVTDGTRSLDDYRRMGLPENEASLHLPQSSGWAHAVDLRTIGRSPVRNGMTATYFWLMGFRTLRHRGTADHLHVSLPLP